jgi:hypothetical protein
MTRPATAIESKHKSNFTREDVSYANFAQMRLAEIGHLLMIRTEIARLECPWEKKLQTGRYERTLLSTPVFFSPFSSSSPQEEEDNAATAAGRARAHYFSALARFVRFPLSFSPSLPVSFLSFFSFAFLLSCLVSSFHFFFFPRLFTY